MVTLLILAFSTLDILPSDREEPVSVWNVVAVRWVDGGRHDRSPPAAAPACVTADPLGLPVLPPLSFGQNSRSIFLFQHLQFSICLAWWKPRGKLQAIQNHQWAEWGQSPRATRGASVALTRGAVFTDPLPSKRPSTRRM